MTTIRPVAPLLGLRSSATPGLANVRPGTWAAKRRFVATVTSRGPGGTASQERVSM